MDEFACIKKVNNDMKYNKCWLYILLLNVRKDGTVNYQGIFHDLLIMSNSILSHNVSGLNLILGDNYANDYHICNTCIMDYLLAIKEHPRCINCGNELSKHYVIGNSLADLELFHEIHHLLGTKYFKGFICCECMVVIDYG